MPTNAQNEQEPLKLRKTDKLRPIYHHEYGNAFPDETIADDLHEVLLALLDAEAGVIRLELLRHVYGTELTITADNIEVVQAEPD